MIGELSSAHKTNILPTGNQAARLDNNNPVTIFK